MGTKMCQWSASDQVLASDEGSRFSDEASDQPLRATGSDQFLITSGIIGDHWRSDEPVINRFDHYQRFQMCFVLLLGDALEQRTSTSTISIELT